MNPTPLPPMQPMKGQMPIGQNPGMGGYGQKPLTPSMGGQMDPSMGGMQGQMMAGGVQGGMAGQYQPQNQQAGGIDYASRQRQLLNTHLQMQGQRAMQAQQQSSGGFFSRLLGSTPRSEAQAAQRQQAQSQGRGGFLSTLGFGRNPASNGAETPKSYATRRHDAYQAYKKQTFERTKMEKEIARRERMIEGSRSSSMQRFNTAKMEKLQKKLEKGEKGYKKSYLGYKYTK